MHRPKLASFAFLTSLCLPAQVASAQGLAWAAGPSLARGRDHHAVAVVQPTGGAQALLVAGGTDYRGVFDDVWLARVRSDGGVEAWQSGPALPRALAGAAAVAVNGMVSVISGQQADRSYVAEVHQAAVAANGTLGAWTAAPGLPRPGSTMPQPLTAGTSTSPAAREPAGRSQTFTSAPSTPQGG